MTKLGSRLGINKYTGSVDIYYPFWAASQFKVISKEKRLIIPIWIDSYTLAIF